LRIANFTYADLLHSWVCQAFDLAQQTQSCWRPFWGTGKGASRLGWPWPGPRLPWPVFPLRESLANRGENKPAKTRPGSPKKQKPERDKYFGRGTAAKFATLPPMKIGLAAGTICHFFSTAVPKNSFRQHLPGTQHSEQRA